MPSVTFRLKQPKSLKPTLIYLFFRANRLDIKYSTSQSIEPKFWNFEKQKAKETQQNPKYSELNALLGNLDSCITNNYRKFINDNQIPTVEILKQELNILLQKEKSIEKNLITFADYLINNRERKPGTIKQLKQTLRLLKEYSQSENSQLHLDGIDLNFYDKFVEFLTKKNYARNSIGSHIKNIKVFMNEALDRKMTTNIQFKNKKFKKIEEESETIFLSIVELEKIFNFNFSEDLKLDKVRDLFIIACFTGLRFSDLVSIRKENIISDGMQIKISTKKTEQTLVIPVNSMVRQIFHKYNGELPTLISNQKMNEYLKIIGEKAEIKCKEILNFTKGATRQSKTFAKYQLITTHTARRSFATNAYLNNVPVISIMKITGHKTEKSFMKYIRISQEENANKLLTHPFFQ